MGLVGCSGIASKLRQAMHETQQAQAFFVQLIVFSLQLFFSNRQECYMGTSYFVLKIAYILPYNFYFPFMSYFHYML